MKLVVRAANAAVTLPTSTATRAGANTGPLPWCQEEPGGGEDEEEAQKYLATLKPSHDMLE